MKRSGLRRHPNPNENKTDRNPAERRFSDSVRSAVSMPDKAVRVTSPQAPVDPSARNMANPRAERSIAVAWLQGDIRPTLLVAMGLVCVRRIYKRV